MNDIAVIQRKIYPIFLLIKGMVSVDYIARHYDLIKVYMHYMNVDVEQVEALIMRPEEWLEEVEKMRRKL